MFGIIYKATSKTSGKSYIGQTTKSLEKRKYQHILTSKKLKNKFQKAIKCYGKEDFIWDVILEEVPIGLLGAIEYECIELFNTFKNGYNSCKGTEWLNGKIKRVREYSEEYKIALSKRNSGKNNPNYGKKHSEETKKKIGAKSKGRLRSLEARQKTSLNCRGNPKIIEAAKRNAPMYAKLYGKPIICVETGKEYNSISEAARELNTTTTMISRVVNGKRKKVKDFQFVFKTQESK